jgi:hypothetical protein
LEKYFGNIGGLIGWASEQIRADAWIYLCIVQKDRSDKRLDKCGGWR